MKLTEKANKIPRLIDIVKRNRELLEELSQTTSDVKKSMSDSLNEALAQGSYDLELVEAWLKNHISG